MKKITVTHYENKYGNVFDSEASAVNDENHIDKLKQSINSEIQGVKAILSNDFVFENMRKSIDEWEKEKCRYCEGAGKREAACTMRGTLYKCSSCEGRGWNKKSVYLDNKTYRKRLEGNVIDLKMKLELLPQLK